MGWRVTAKKGNGLSLEKMKIFRNEQGDVCTTWGIPFNCTIELYTLTG